MATATARATPRATRARGRARTAIVARRARVATRRAPPRVAMRVAGTGDDADDVDVDADAVDDDGARTTARTTRDARYYEGFVTEPVTADVGARDIWTPTIALVTRSAAALAAMFAAFLWSNGLPPFDG